MNLRRHAQSLPTTPTLFPVFKSLSLLRLPVTELSDQARAALHSDLCYARSISNNGRYPEFIQQPTYLVVNYDDEKHWLVGAGVIPRVTAFLARYGYTVKVCDVDPHKEASATRTFGLPDDVEEFSPRDWQRAGWRTVLESDRQLLRAPTGAGKSTLITMLCRLWPYARILYTTVGVQLVHQMHDTLLQYTPAVWRWRRTPPTTTPRIICTTVGTLGNIQGEFDVAFVDECDEVCTVARAAAILAIPARRVYGLTANPTCKLDGSDRWREVLFGPEKVLATYQDAVNDGDIVKIEVRWRPCKVKLQERSYVVKSSQERYYIWRNRYRNDLIVKDAARHLAAGDQVLIVTRTLEHAAALYARAIKAKLDVEVAFGRSAQKKWMQFCAQFDVPDPVCPTNAELDELREAFADGTVRFAIANMVWNRGVDFRQLAVLCRADAGGTKGSSIQIKGRLSRTHTESGKSVGILYDYGDQFSRTYRNRARSRRSTYAEDGHEQIEYKVEGDVE